MVLNYCRMGRMYGTIKFYYFMKFHFLGRLLTDKLSIPLKLNDCRLVVTGGGGNLAGRKGLAAIVPLELFVI